MMRTSTATPFHAATVQYRDPAGHGWLWTIIALALASVAAVWLVFDMVTGTGQFTSLKLSVLIMSVLVAAARLWFWRAPRPMRITIGSAGIYIGERHWNWADVQRFEAHDHPAGGVGLRFVCRDGTVECVPLDRPLQETQWQQISTRLREFVNAARIDVSIGRPGETAPSTPPLAHPPDTVRLKAG